MASGGGAVPYSPQRKQMATGMESVQQDAPLMVFLVEDSLAIRARLAATIRGIEGAELVGEAGTV